MWNESWVRDHTVDERKRKQSVTPGFGDYSIAEAWEWQRQLNRPVKNDNSVMRRLYCDLCSRSGMTAIRIPNSHYEHMMTP